ncbi:uncharacterized protein LOC115768446 [Drosophila novamexicana]|uniref:uncharacterized protein LOC115768446 n=1 Tax=Drosophila novamexicana TaxID=47314 RepID=UPI0011E5E623|nr:uncharacterized protein LOC115768446 [Drosophila novamexicana]
MRAYPWLATGLTLALALDLVCAGVAPMTTLYKRNSEEKYEPDLVAVSSTVIPLTVLEVSYGLGGKPSDAYKAAYLRKLRKQVLQRAQAEASGATPLAELPPAPSDADALITVKSKQAKVKAV